MVVAGIFGPTLARPPPHAGKAAHDHCHRGRSATMARSGRSFCNLERKTTHRGWRPADARIASRSSIAGTIARRFARTLNMALNDLTPQLRTRLSRLERVVGWFVTIASVLLLGGLGYYVYNIAERKGWFLEKVNYYTFVRTASGLKPGEPVRLMGRDVGEIMEITPMGPYEPYNIY